MPSERRLRWQVGRTTNREAMSLHLDELGQWRRRLDKVVGRVALRLQPRLLGRLVDGHVPEDSFQAHAVRALLSRQGPQMSDVEISALHRAWWSSRDALQQHREHLSQPSERYDSLVQPLLQSMRANDVQGLCEIGCGNGRMLNRIACLAPQLQSLIGVDLNLEQVLLNRAQLRDSRVHYRAADGLSWDPPSDHANWAWACFGGVLAYFSQFEVAALFARIAQRSPAMLAFAEPIADETIIDQADPSMVCTRTRRFSHPYQALLANAGLPIEWMGESRIDGNRWLMVLARR